MFKQWLENVEKEITLPNDMIMTSADRQGIKVISIFKSGADSWVAGEHPSLTRLIHYPKSSQESDLIAYVVAKPNQDGTYHIAQVLVDQQYRRQGLATLLYKQLEQGVKLSKESPEKTNLGDKFRTAYEGKRLPPILYHVTTAGNEIIKQGFMPATQHKKGTVFGGGFQEAVSFTDNLEWAKLYKLALEFTQMLLYENLLDNKQEFHYRLQPFKPNWDKLKSIDAYIIEKDIEMVLFMLPAITQGRFPPIFGGGLKQRLLPDSDIDILSVSTLPGNGKSGPQKWTTNPKEKEYRIYDPDNFDNKTIDYVG